MVKKKRNEEICVVLPVQENNNFSANLFEPLYSGSEKFLLGLFEVVKRESIFLCIFSSLVLFLLAWIANPALYLLFVPVSIFSIAHIFNEYKFYLLKKDFEENGIF